MTTLLLRWSSSKKSLLLFTCSIMNFCDAPLSILSKRPLIGLATKASGSMSNVISRNNCFFMKFVNLGLLSQIYNNEYTLREKIEQKKSNRVKCGYFLLNKALGNTPYISLKHLLKYFGSLNPTL